MMGRNYAYQQARTGTFSTYKNALAYIREGRSGWDRPVANNTRIHVRDDGAIGLRLHQTDVVVYYENGDVSFDSGGWRTVTTSDQVAYHPDYSIFSAGGIWFIYHRPSHEAAERRLRRKYGLPETWSSQGDGGYESPHLGFVGPRSRGYGFWLEVAEVIGRKEAVAMERAFNKELKGKSYLFFDGIRFTARGKCLNGLTQAETEKKVTGSNALRKRIREYSKAAVQHLHEGHVLGEPHWTDEITSFDYRYCERLLEERTFPDILFFEAMEEINLPDIGRQLHLGERYDEATQQRMIGGTYETSYGVRDHATLDIVANQIYKFICKRMLPDREVRNPFGGMAGHSILS